MNATQGSGSKAQFDIKCGDAMEATWVNWLSGLVGSVVAY